MEKVYAKTKMTRQKVQKEAGRSGKTTGRETQTRGGRDKKIMPTGKRRNTRMAESTNFGI